MSEPITPEREHVRRRAFNLSCDDQLVLARALAANVGYELKPEAPFEDDKTPLWQRVSDLERAVFGKARE